MKPAFRALTILSTVCLLANGGDVFASDRCPIPQTEINSIEAAQARAIKAAEVYKLSPIPLGCTLYQSGYDGGKYGKSGPYWVSFHENHTPECGGDPNTGPRLFTITLTRKGQMRTDAYGMDVVKGRYRPLKCPKK